MNVSRIFVTTAVALSVLTALGCASQRPREVAAAPVVIQVPEQVVVAAPMPADPIIVQAPASPVVATTYEQPVTMASADMITERAPQADRN